MKPRLSTKVCPICTKRLPATQFGVCRARKDGRNLYCKSCIRQKVEVGRKLKKEMKAARKRAQETVLREVAETDRKPNVISPILKSPVTKVLFAVKDGHRTRREIREATGLNWDQVGDALAELAFCRNEIRIKRRDDYEEIQLVAA